MKLLLPASLVLAFLLLCTAMPAGAQNLATQKIIAKYKADYVPEFKSSLAGRSGDPALANIDVDMDFASFGDNSADLDLAVRQLNMAKGAILFVAKDAAGKAAAEKGLKRIVVRKAAGASGRTVTLSGGTLTLAATSYELSDVIGSAEIQKLLLANL